MSRIKRIINEDKEIDWMIRRNLPDVLKIETENFRHPWSYDDFIYFLRQRNIIGISCLDGERTIGFLVYRFNRDNLDLINMSVDKEYQRQKIGENLVKVLKDKLEGNSRRKYIGLEIRETNLPAQLFFKKQGFMATGEVLKGWYEDSGEDGYVMEFVHRSSGVYVPKNRISSCFDGKPIW